MIAAIIAALFMAPTDPGPLPLPQQPAAPKQPAEQVDALIEAFAAALGDQDEARSRELAALLIPELNLLLENSRDLSGEGRSALKLTRGVAFWTLDRIAEADRDLLAQSADMLTEIGYWDFRFDRAVQENDGHMVARLLVMDAAEVENPRHAYMHNLTLDSIFIVNAALDEDEELARAFHQALIDAEFDFDAPPGDRDYLYRWVFQDRFAEGDIAGAREALAAMRSPNSITEYITTRKYEAFWPFLEQRHGRDLGRLVERYEAELEAAKNLDDARFRMAYASHLSNTGQYQRLVDELAPFVADWDRNLSEGEYAHWTVNNFAFGEIEIGRIESAVARMTELSEQEAGSYLIGVQINRLLLMLDARRFEEALAGAEELDSDPGSANEFGRMFIRQAAACAAHELGLTQQAESWGELIEAAPEENRQAALRYYLCTQKLDAAERHMIAWLEDESPGGMVNLLQDYRRKSNAGLWEDEMIALQEQVAARPAVQQALRSAGRILSLDLAE